MTKVKSLGFLSDFKEIEDIFDYNIDINGLQRAFIFDFRPLYSEIR